MNRKDPEIFISGSESRNMYFGKVARLPELHFFPYRARHYHNGKSTNCKSTVLICLSAFSFDWRVNPPKLVKFNPRGGLMVTALDSSVRALARDTCVVCLPQTLYSHQASLHLYT